MDSLNDRSLPLQAVKQHEREFLFFPIIVNKYYSECCLPEESRVPAAILVDQLCSIFLRFDMNLWKYIAHKPSSFRLFGSKYSLHYMDRSDGLVVCSQNAVIVNLQTNVKNITPGLFKPLNRVKFAPQTFGPTVTNYYSHRSKNILSYILLAMIATFRFYFTNVC